MEEVKALIRQVIKNQHELLGLRDVELAGKWEGGKIILQPGREGLKPAEIPIDVLAKKVVAVREKLRVLEQKVNNHPKLSQAEKIDLQQYITRAYGSLTTFNLIFKHEEDKFRGPAA